MKKTIGSILLVICMMISIFEINNLPVSAAGKIKLNKTAVTLQVGEKYQLSVKNMPKNGKVIWTSASKSKATVSKKGVITAKKQGKATIKAKLTYKSGGKKRTRNFSCRVTIKKKTTASGKSLVVYFSAPVQKRSGQVDGISSASQTAEGKTYKVMYTFFDTYDLKGKNIIPFCTHAASGLSGTVGRIKKLEPQATVYKGLEIYRTDVTSSDSRVKSWIQKKAK